VIPYQVGVVDTRSLVAEGIRGIAALQCGKLLVLGRYEKEMEKTGKRETHFIASERADFVRPPSVTIVQGIIVICVELGPSATGVSVRVGC